MRLLRKYKSKLERSSTFSYPIRLNVSGSGGIKGELKIALRSLNELKKISTIGNNATTMAPRQDEVGG